MHIKHKDHRPDATIGDYHYNWTLLEQPFQQPLLLSEVFKRKKARKGVDQEIGKEADQKG